jgi:hypothetical protein
MRGYPEPESPNGCVFTHPDRCRSIPQRLGAALSTLPDRPADFVPTILEHLNNTADAYCSNHVTGMVPNRSSQRCNTRGHILVTDCITGLSHGRKRPAKPFCVLNPRSEQVLVNPITRLVC